VFILIIFENNNPLKETITHLIMPIIKLQITKFLKYTLNS